MKRILAACVCMALLLQMMVISAGAQTAPDLTGQTDAALGCAAFGSTWTSGYEAEKAVDGKETTWWASTANSYAHRLVLDLGAAYRISTIGYLPQNDETAATGFVIYLSNDNEFVTKTQIYSQGETAASVTEKSYYTVNDTNTYRYVVVEKAAEAGILGIAELNVYVPQADFSASRDESIKHINNNMRANRAGGSPSGVTANIFTCESDKNQNSTSSSAGAPIYMMFDLGTAQTISYVTYSLWTQDLSERQLDNRSNLLIIGSNDASYANYDVLATQTDLAGAPDNTFSGMVLYQTAEQYKNNTYRYVGVMTETPLYNITRLSANAIRIYTSQRIANLNGKVDIAADRPAFASTYSPLHGAQNAVDGNEATWWESGTSISEHRFVVDLGAAYPIGAIGYLPPEDATAAGGFTVYGSNDNTFVAKTEICTQAGAAALAETTYYPTPDDTAYRYIIVEKALSGGKLGIAELNVFVPQNAFSGTLGENNRLMHVNNNLKAVRVGGSPSGDTASAFTGENNQNQAVHSSENIPLYMMFDLGTAQTLAYIAYSVYTGGTGDTQLDNRSNFMFIGSNDPTYQTYDVLAEQEGLAGRPNDNHSGLLVYEIAEAYKNTAYRYVGALATEAYAGRIRFAANTMNFYTNAKDAAPMTFRKLVATMEDGVVSFSSNVLSADNATLIFGAFDEDNHYLGSVAKENVLEKGGSADVSFTVDFADAGILAEDISRVQLIAVDSLQTMNLMAVVDDLTKKNEIWDLGNTPIAGYNESVKRDTQTYLINGSTDAKAVVAVILDEGIGFDSATGSDIRYAAAQKPDAEGGFAFAFTFLPDDPLGDYSLMVGTKDTENYGSDAPYVLENMDTTGIINAFKTVDAAGFASLMETYSDYFSTVSGDLEHTSAAIGDLYVLTRDNIALFNSGVTVIDSIEDVQTVLAAAVVADAVKNGENYGDMIETYTDALPDIFGTYYNSAEFEALMDAVKQYVSPDTAQNIADAMRRAVGLSLIQGGTYDDRITALTAYADALGIASATLDTDITYLQIAKKLDNSALAAKSYAAGMNGVVSGIVTELENEMERDNNNGSSSGRGGSRGGSSTAVFPTVQMPELPEVTPAPETTDTQDYFHDLAGYDWAKDAINHLVSKNIVNGRAEGVFAPGDFVTREEVVKQLVLVFELTTPEAENAFKDCEKNAWYYPFVTAASEHSIVNGVSATEFGIGQQVTRQDLAAMIYRALDQRGFTTKTSQIFDDHDSIAGYAQYEVAALASVGVIQGFPDGSFMPQNNTTRAQAAVIFDRVMNILEEMAAEQEKEAEAA